MSLDQDALDLDVYLYGSFLRVVASLGPERHLEEGISLVAVVADGTELVAHAELGHHRPGDVSGPLEVVLRTGRHLAKRNLFGAAAAEENRQLVQQIISRQQIPVFQR